MQGQPPVERLLLVDAGALQRRHPGELLDVLGLELVRPVAVRGRDAAIGPRVISGQWRNDNPGQDQDLGLACQGAPLYNCGLTRVYLALGGMNPMADQASPPSGVKEDEKKNSSQFVGFQIDDQEYAFRIEQIQEIVILDQITRTPQVPEYCEGVSNLRGSIIPIINLRRLFGIEPRPADGETRTIVVNVGERTMGCTVDMVSQVIRIPQDSIQPAPETVTAEGAHYISGFARLDGRLVILLDIDQLLDPAQLDRVKQTSGSEEE